MAGLRTYRADLTVSNADGEETYASSAKIETVVPDRSHQLSADGGEAIYVGETMYLRLSAGGVWSAIEYEPPKTSREMAEGLFYEPLMDLKASPDETVDGIECYHFAASRDMKTVAEQRRESISELDPSDPDYASQRQDREMAADALEKIVFNVELWIGKDDNLLRQVGFEQVMQIEEDPGTTTEQRTTGTFHYYDFNADITIEPPPASEVRQREG